VPEAVVGVSNRPSSVAQRIAYAFAQPIYVSNKHKNSELNIFQKSTKRVGDVFALGSGIALLFRLCSKLFRGDFAGDGAFENIKKWMPETLLFAVSIASKILAVNGTKLYERKNQREDYKQNVIPILIKIVGERIGSLRDTEEHKIKRAVDVASREDSVYLNILRIGLLNNNELVDEILTNLFGMELVKGKDGYYVQTQEDLMVSKDGNKYGLRVYIDESSNFYDLLNTNNVYLVSKPEHSLNVDYEPVQKIEDSLAELVRNWLPQEMRKYFKIDESPEEAKRLEEISRQTSRLSTRLSGTHYFGGGNIITVFDGRRAEGGNAGA